MLRIQKLIGFTAMATVLAACQHPLAPRLLSPNPYGYLKKSALCQVQPVDTDSSGQKRSTSMSVRSDDGICSIVLTKKGGGNYASFGVIPHPQHGKVLTYNHDGQTILNYQAETAYVGPDAFSVVLIPSRDAPRDVLNVTVKVEAASLPAAPAKSMTDKNLQTSTKASVAPASSRKSSGSASSHHKK